MHMHALNTICATKHYYDRMMVLLVLVDLRLRNKLSGADPHLLALHKQTADSGYQPEGGPATQTSIPPRPQSLAGRQTATRRLTKKDRESKASRSHMCLELRRTQTTQAAQLFLVVKVKRSHCCDGYRLFCVRVYLKSLVPK